MSRVSIALTTPVGAVVAPDVTHLHHEVAR
jgi:hypothetical protein